MAVASNIQFTTQQARSIAGVSPEAWRHWRKNLHYIAEKKGRTARFTMGEIVVLCAISNIVKKLGLRMAILSDGLDQLFKASAPLSLLYLQDCCFVITEKTGDIVKSNPAHDLESPAVVIPCEGIVAQVLRSAFQDPELGLQKSLPFPPASIGRGSA